MKQSKNVGKGEEKTEANTTPRRKAPIVVFLLGLTALVAGVAWLVINLVSTSGVRDAEYLVSVGEWAREDAPTVIWEFSEIGKGTLTTDNHQNDYEFIWALEGDKLKIETEWLEILNDEYDYTLDQGARVLTLVDGDESWTFSPKQ